MLARFQMMLGTAVRQRRVVPAEGGAEASGPSRAGLSAREVSFLDGLADNRGFWFTVSVQRSWCELRTWKAARMALGCLPVDQRRALVAEWIEGGGGTASFFATEADELLEFIAARLPERSDLSVVCRVEQAVQRANQATAAGAAEMLASAAATSGPVIVGRGRGATLLQVPTRFGAATTASMPAAEPDAEAAPAPDLTLLFAPGIGGLFREATTEEVLIWRACLEPAALEALARAGHATARVAALVAIGALDWLHPQA